MTSRTLEDYLNNLRMQLNKGINLLDYFLVIGPKPEIFMNDWLYDNDLDDLINDYLPQLSPELLTQFPPIEKTITGLDDTIIQHCFPKGYTVESFPKQPEAELFSIILDNNLFSIDYPYKYVSCLKFYEGLSSYRKLYDRYNQLIDKHKNSMSKSDMPGTSRDICSTQGSSASTSTSRIATARTTFGSVKRVKYRSLYLPKCICLVSLYPFFLEYGKILKALYQYSSNLKVRIPLEKFIQSLVIEVPVPPRGLLSVEYPLFNEVITLKQSCINELPSLNIEFEKLFVVFQLEQIMVIFKHVLLESRIVFFSSKISLLTPIIFSALSLIYPFEYPFNIASILPKEAYHLIENVTNVIVGVNEKYTPSFFNDNDIDVSDITILIVDIDDQKVELRKQTAKKPEEELPELPRQLKEKLEGKINAYIQQIKGRKEPREAFSLTIRSLFLKFFIRLLKFYNRYLNADIYNHNNKKSLIHNAFKVKEFMQIIEACDRPFYNKLILETQLFVDFVYKRMTPKSKKEKLQILFFEEKMFEKYFNKKTQQQFPFISSDDYLIKNCYSIDKVKDLTRFEKKYYLNKDNHINCLFNGLIVDAVSDKPDNQDYAFSSPIFPRLQSDFYFKTSIEQKSYFIPQNLSDNLEPINSDLLGKSHLNTVEIKTCEMDNYIYLCWIKLWALSFWYHDQQERNCRFQQLIEVLDKVTHHEMDIFNMLFQALFVNKGEEDMIITLYQRLIFYRLNPSSFVFDMVSKLIEKREKRGIISHGNIIKYINNFKYESKEIEKAFRRRTYKNKNDTRIIKEQIKIYGNEECFSCKTMITLKDIINHIDQAKKQNLWVECPKCHKDFFPTLTIRFGAELNPKGELKIDTSSCNDFAFYSPFTLYYNLIPSLASDYKLDIDHFKINFLPIFWNCVFYFKLKGLNCDFFLPYEDSATKRYIGMSMLKNSGFDISYHSASLKEASPLERSIAKLASSGERPVKFSSGSLIPRNEIEVEYHLNKKAEDANFGSGEYIPMTTNEDMIVCTEESLINANGFVDNSSVYCDTISRYTESDLYEEYSLSKYKCKTNGLYQLMEIKEDQNENAISQMNTPNKPIVTNRLGKESSEKVTPSMKLSGNLSVKDLESMWEVKSDRKESVDFKASFNSLSFGNNCSIMSPEVDLNKTPLMSDKERAEPVTLKAASAFQLDNPLNSNSNEDHHNHMGYDRKTTPTKLDFSIDPEVIKEFREKYSSKTERSERSENKKEGWSSNKPIVLCHSSENLPNNR